MRVVEGIPLPVDGHRAGGRIHRTEQQAIRHVILRMPPDELSLQLELHDGDGLVHFGQGVHAALEVILVVRVAREEPGAVPVSLLAQRRSCPAG